MWVQPYAAELSDWNRHLSVEEIFIFIVYVGLSFLMFLTWVFKFCFLLRHFFICSSRFLFGQPTLYMRTLSPHCGFTDQCWWPSRNGHFYSNFPRIVKRNRIIWVIIVLSHRWDNSAFILILKQKENFPISQGNIQGYCGAIQRFLCLDFFLYYQRIVNIQYYIGFRHTV